MKTSQVAAMLEKLTHASLPVLLVGSPGVGKSDLGAQAANQAGMDLTSTKLARAPCGLR